MWVNTSEFAGKDDEDLTYGYYTLPFEFSGKVFLVTLTLLFFSFILFTPISVFLNSENKKSFKPCSDERQNGFKGLKLKRCSSYNHFLPHVNMIVIVSRH